MADDIRGEPKLNKDSQNMVPGDPEKKMMARRLEKGIPINGHVKEKFEALAARLGIKPVGVEA